MCYARNNEQDMIRELRHKINQQEDHGAEALGLAMLILAFAAGVVAQSIFHIPFPW